MLEQDITQKRKDRHHITQEDFTPPEVIEILFENIPEDLFNDFSKTFCDPCAGVGNILMHVLNKRLEYCKTEDDIINALSTLYGVELMEDNVEELRNNLYNIIGGVIGIISSDLNTKIIEILNNNFVASDAFEWDFGSWCKKTSKVVSLF